MIKFIWYFLISGSFITAASILAEKGNAFLGGILLVLPNMSIAAFYFINRSTGITPTMQALKSSLLGTLFIWPFYMLLLLYLIPKIGVNYSLISGFILSVILAILFIFFCQWSPIHAWIFN